MAEIHDMPRTETGAIEAVAMLTPEIELKRLKARVAYLQRRAAERFTSQIPYFLQAEWQDLLGELERASK